MIGYIKGKVLSVGLSEAIIETQGLGYELHCAFQTLGELQNRETAELWVYTHVREDALQLFGFASRNEKELFLSLLKVNGIGPKSALNILSATSLESLQNLIESGDAKALSKLPKVGKKTAEQMILTLKGKLTFVESQGAQAGVGNRDAIVSAMVHLGFRVADVEKVVADFDANIEIEQGVREALVALTN